jgi:hypothetical protein
MAGGAGHGIVFRQPHVIEKFAAQRYGLRSGRVIWRYRNRRQPQRRPEIDNLADRPVTVRVSTSNAKDRG